MSQTKSKKAVDVGGVVQFSSVERAIIEIRGQKVIMDADVAVLYGVETKRVNEAVKNNQEKFPEGYIFTLTSNEKKEVVENFDHLANAKFAATLPKAFTEKGLYMLATILKSQAATATTLAIVETFAKIRELSRTVASLSETTDRFGQKRLMQHSGEILADVLGEGMKVTDQETTFELNLAVLKFKHTVKRKAKP